MCDDPPLEDEELRSEAEDVKEDVVEYVEDLEEANPEFPIDTEDSD